MIQVYNEQRKRFHKSEQAHKLENDPSLISWSSSLVASLERNKILVHDSSSMIHAMYRPFCKQWLYYEPSLIHRVGQMPHFFKDGSAQGNLIIAIGGAGCGTDFSPILVSCPFCLQPNHSTQCFPLYILETATTENNLLTAIDSVDSPHSTKWEGITDSAICSFHAAYGKDSITKEDLFYYVYGLLHSPDYLRRYGDNLSKELPRIPAVKKFEDFQAFSKAGRDLANWHLEYETVECYPVTVQLADGNSGVVEKRGAKHDKLLNKLRDEQFYVRKMKFPKTKESETGKSVNDRSTVIYNDYITVKNIPLEAYDYVVNGKSAIEWVIERQSVTTDKDSGIVNDANLWATETMNNAAYSLELLLRVITVSLETHRIVKSLPRLELEMDSAQ